MKFFKALWVVLPVCTAALSPWAQANVGETFGYGSRSAALGGATVAVGADGFSTALNPATLSLLGEKRLIVSYAILAMFPSFEPISNVVTSNTFTSDQLQRGPVPMDYRSTAGQMIGISYQLAPDWHKLTAGVTFYTPFEPVSTIDTGETFLPEYVLHRARTQRPQLDFGVAMEIAPRLTVGLGAHLAYTLTSNASVFLQTSSDKPSQLRITASLKPKLAPYLGLAWSSVDLPKDGIGSRDPWPVGATTLGAVWRLPVAYRQFLNINSGARAFGSSLPAIDFNFAATSTLFYDPMSVEWGGTYQISQKARLFAQLDYQFWSRFEAPAISIQDPSESCPNGTSCGIIISGGKNPAFQYRDIWVPHLGQELQVGTTTLRLGYSYKPSILRGLPTGAGNYLDPPEHRIGAGVGLPFKTFLGFNTHCTLDLHAAYHVLVKQQIQKTPGNELGQGTGDLKIGAPGYTAGGKIYGGGASLTLAF